MLLSAEAERALSDGLHRWAEAVLIQRVASSRDLRAGPHKLA